MPYVGEPFDATYFEGHTNPSDPPRVDNYTSYAAILPERWVMIADDIEKELEAVDGRDVLDAGGAYGALAEELRLRGANVTVIDISAFAVSEGQSRYPQVNFQQADLVQGVGGRPNRFDLVVALGIHDCMPTDTDARSLNNELSRLLRPTGSAYFLFSLVHDDYPTRPTTWWQSEGDAVFPGKDNAVDEVNFQYGGRLVAKG